MPGLALPSDAFRLGSLVVVPSLNRLVRDGAAEDVEPRVMRVLAVLAETPGEVVTRATLFESVWGDAVVNDESLTRAVSELRKALGDEAAGAVETIRGTGYRLARPPAPVVAPPPSGEASPEASGERPARGVSLVVLAIALAALSLVVALWAAWPRSASDEGGAPELRVPSLGPAAGSGSEGAPVVLDSTSPYYQPGMSDLGVYYDSTTGRYFRFSNGE